MNCNRIFLSTTLFALLLAPRISFGQLFTFREMAKAYQNGTRDLNGSPGADYWQNRGDYRMNISFNPQTLLLHGDETITYFNNSPDTLDEIVIRLFPDYYKHNMVRNYAVDEKDENDGVAIESFMLGNEKIDTANSYHEGTNLIVRPSHAIPPHTQVTMQIAWHYTLDSGSQNRTGQVDSTSSFIAYCFPRVAVYDDVSGWDRVSYLGIQEFYNDFGDFDAAITVPAGYVVWATGELMNAQQVLAPRILDKLRNAQNTFELTHVIAESDYQSGHITAANGFNTFHFKAHDVTDFAFALSNHYLWDARSVLADKSTGRKVLVETAFNKDHRDYYDVINQAWRSVQIMSDTFPAVPFPFPHITVFDGTDQMEYPMMINDNPTRSRADAVQLTTHEIFHSYFPFYMGINETQYAWMDEGWATLGESLISPMLGEPEDEGIYSRTRFERNAGTLTDVPMITNTKLQSNIDYYANSYGKAGVCYDILRDLLGNEEFLKTLHVFMGEWHGKHPTPYDFFYTFNKTSGENLDWFWKPWFFEWAYPDLGIKSVITDRSKVTVTVERKGNMPVPVTLYLTLSNGKVIEHHETAALWKDGRSTYVFKTKTDAAVTDVKLGALETPDSRRKDNEWKP